MLNTVLRWLAALLTTLIALLLLALLWLAVFGWNWARVPLQDLALQRSGRVLHIGGDLGLQLAWPLPRVQADDVSFANPGWAAAPQMLKADRVEATIDLRELLRGRLAVIELRLQRPQVFLEQASGGRKTWLLDRLQTDDAARIPIGRLLLDRGEVSYIDLPQRTALHATLSTVAAADPTRSLVVTASGMLRGLPVTAEGSGGGALAWRDESTPYPLQLSAALGPTHVQAAGSVTGLMHFRAIDLQLAVRGDSLASLFPLLGIALPPTPAYNAKGRLLHSGTSWRYEAFSGQVGSSDLAGSVQVLTGGARPALSGTLNSRRLDLADLGPAVGVDDSAASQRMLPELPINTASWASLDADVTLQAQTLLRAKALPLDQLQLRLQLQDRQLTLDPLNFAMAGGQLQAQLRLDGRSEPLRGHLKLQLRGLQLGRLLPTVDLSKTSLGRLDGNAEIRGQGASVGRLLATADGHLSLVAQNGQISRLMMEQIGLHLLEILQLSLTGDRTVALNCAIADFGIAGGVMQARALVLDTAVNTVEGSGTVNLAQETLDLTLRPRTKVSSLVALRGPVHVRGSFSQPVVSLDSGSIAARGLGALALGLLNPLLALVPLFEAGPGTDSACSQLVKAAAGGRTRP